MSRDIVKQCKKHGELTINECYVYYSCKKCSKHHCEQYRKPRKKTIKFVAYHKAYDRLHKSNDDSLMKLYEKGEYKKIMNAPRKKSIKP